MKNRSARPPVSLLIKPGEITKSTGRFMDWKLETKLMKQYFWGFFYFLWSFLTQSPVAFGVFSSVYAVWLKSSNALIGRFQPNNVRWIYTIFYSANHVWKLLPWTVSEDCVKYSIDAYHRCIYGNTFCRFVSGT